MRRREFIAGLSSAAAWPVAADAQQAEVPVIGWLTSVSRNAGLPGFGVFAQGLAETGYVVGRNVTIEPRAAEGDSGRLPALAADLVRRHVTVIVAIGGNATLVAKAATQTIPVVFLMANDPIDGAQPQSSLGQSHRRHPCWHRVNRKAP